MPLSEIRYRFNEPVVEAEVEVERRHPASVGSELLIIHDVRERGKSEMQYLEALLLEGLDGDALERQCHQAIRLGQVLAVLAQIAYDLAAIVNRVKEGKRHQLSILVEGEKPAHVGFPRHAAAAG